jgi:hypothetical protein
MIELTNAGVGTEIYINPDRILYVQKHTLTGWVTITFHNECVIAVKGPLEEVLSQLEGTRPLRPLKPSIDTLCGSDE